MYVICSNSWCADYFRWIDDGTQVKPKVWLDLIIYYLSNNSFMHGSMLTSQSPEELGVGRKWELNGVKWAHKRVPKEYRHAVRWNQVKSGFRLYIILCDPSIFPVFSSILFTAALNLTCTPTAFGFSVWTARILYCCSFFRTFFLLLHSLSFLSFLRLSEWSQYLFSLLSL